MKLATVLSVMAVMMSGWLTSNAQGMQAEVPGDNFSLEGALELFKKSSSPEEFERMLNSPDSKVNNLDLNGDGYVDYIRVLNRTERNVHLFILQAVISKYESQDVAVIELEKLANGKAVLQIIGDEDIYGITTIIEPTQEVRTYAGTRSSTTVVNVWAWPTVQYVYGPRYTVWISPWGWHMRPVWYRTWRPVSYVHYHTVWVPYRPYYNVCHSRRIIYAHEMYRPHRTTSVIVYNRHHTQINHYRTVNVNNDRNRNGRTRDDNGRNYGRDGRTSSPSNAPSRNRDDATRNGRSSYQSETTTSRDRNGSHDSQRYSTPMKREDFNKRESPAAPANRTDLNRPKPANTEVRSAGTQRDQQRPVATPTKSDNQVTRPVDTRSRTNANMQQRNTNVPANREANNVSQNRTRSTETRVASPKPEARERTAPVQMNRNSSAPRPEQVNRNSGGSNNGNSSVSRPAPAERKAPASQPSQGGSKGSNENRRSR